MKRIVIIAIIASNAFLACKKDRTCACTVTKIGTSTTTAALTFSVAIIGNVPVIDTSFVSPVNETNTYDKTFNKTTKAAAKNNCVSYKEPYNEVITNSAPPLMLSTTSKGERVYTCELK